MERPDLKPETVLFNFGNKVLKVRICEWDSEVTLYDEDGSHYVKVNKHIKEIVELLGKRVDFLRDYKEWKTEEPGQYKMEVAMY